MAFPKNLNKLKTFSSWPANYRFAYAMDIVGIFVCLGFSSLAINQRKAGFSSAWALLFA
ncbi:hypothetical protein [Corynebacterium stationis]|uniref:hypothetical protein n=1 Tax=Corynebacterium stationis TaxID=1705 RepID=UPI000A6C90D1|nr:hypothetical protein [Corynebacterium stationis]